MANSVQNISKFFVPALSKSVHARITMSINKKTNVLLSLVSNTKVIGVQTKGKLEDKWMLLACG